MLMAKTSLSFLTVQCSAIFDSNKCQYVVCGAALQGEGGGGTPYNGLYGEAPPEKNTFFSLGLALTLRKANFVIRNNDLK